MKHHPAQLERYLIHRRAMALTRTKDRYSEEIRKLKQAKNHAVYEIYRRYDRFLEDVHFKVHHPDSETLRVDLSTIKAERCLYLVAAIFQEDIPSLALTKVGDELRDTCIELLGELNLREQAILMYRFGLADTHGEILTKVGKRFGVSRERIRQIEAKALRRLRYPRRSRRLMDYLGEGDSG